MSVEAIGWALGQAIERSSAKFVLVAMANCAGPDMTCWPSISYLCDATCQDRKTVMENIKRLKESGHLTDTGERKGSTGSVVVYRMSSPENGTAKQSQKRVSLQAEAVPKTDTSSTVFPQKQYRFSAEAVPKTGHGTVKEPSRNRQEPKTRPAKPPEVDLDLVIGAGIPEPVAIEFIAHKRQVKAPLTARAWADHCREAEKAGWTALQAAEKVMARGWKGFESSYVRSEARPASAGAPPTVASRDAVRTAEYLAAQAARGAVRPSAEVIAKLGRVRGGKSDEPQEDACKS